jgi:hypothetical protein
VSVTRRNIEDDVAAAERELRHALQDLLAMAGRGLRNLDEGKPAPTMANAAHAVDQASERCRALSRRLGVRRRGGAR